MAKRGADVDALSLAWAQGNYHLARQLAGRRVPPAAAAAAAAAGRLRVGGWALGLGLFGLAAQLAAWAWVLSS